MSQLRTAAEPVALEREAGRLRARLRSHYHLDEQTLAELRGHSMTIMPWDFAVAFAYRLRWQPLPTIQISQAYTSWLDEHAAKVLRSRRGPQRIVRAPEMSLDLRNAAWDMPDGSAVSKKTKAGPISADRLKSFVERIEKLEEERHAIGGDIRDVYSEAKGVGYDTRTMRKIVSLRKMDAAERDEQEALLDTYKHALGMA